MKKLAVAMTAFLALGIAVAPAADAKDTSWGCGGACRHAGR